MTAAMPTHNGEVVIDVHGLTKKFDGRAVVRDLSMQVKRGMIYGFLGPNGSGKTTTIRMLCGLLTPGRRHRHLPRLRHPHPDRQDQTPGRLHDQRFSLYQDLSVRENLEFVARLYAVPDAPRAARDMVARLGLQGREEQLAGSLSGGWKQRLALGACTLPNPRLSAARRANRGRRSQGAARVLERNPRARGARPHGAGLNPLHGRGRALPRDRIYRLRYALDARHRGARCGRVQAPDLYGLRRRPAKAVGRLMNKPGVDSVAPFGTSLHVSGRDPEALEAAIAPYRNDPDLHWTKSEPSLEDVFIDLMSRRQGQFPMSALSISELVGSIGRTRAMPDQGVHPAQARPGFLRHDRDGAADAAFAVRLCHQRDAARPAHGGVVAREQRSRPLGAQGAGEHQVLQVTRQVRDEAEFDRVLAAGEVLFAIEIPRNFERAVRRGERPAILVAAGRDRSGGVRFPRSRRWPACPDRLGSRPRPARHRRVAVRGAHATRATIRRPRHSSTSCRVWSHHSHHDHADSLLRCR